jgi:hypothetical protein
MAVTVIAAVPFCPSLVAVLLCSGEVLDDRMKADMFPPAEAAEGLIAG